MKVESNIPDENEFAMKSGTQRFPRYSPVSTDRARGLHMTHPKPQAQLDHETLLAAQAAAALVEDGARLGLGSGSTSAHFVRALAHRVRTEGLRVTGLPTSAATARLAQELGIPLIEPARALRLDLTVDGADEISPALALIKGGGGAMLREKVVASIARRFIVIADSSKLVTTLGKFPLPVEAIPFAAPLVMDRIAELGGSPVIRPDPRNPGAHALTDQGNVILDCDFKTIDDPDRLAAALDAVPGVVEHGLFIKLAHEALIAMGDQVFLLRPGRPLSEL
jgi:ribose 5-phosphate isomerase A